MGDHLPYLALAQRLQGRGHDVLMVINQAMHAYAERAGIEAVALSDVERGPREARENAWAWDHWQSSVDRQRSSLKVKARPLDFFTRQVQELAGYAGGADLLLATAIRVHGLPAHLISGVPWVTLSVNPSAFVQSTHTAVREQQADLRRRYYNDKRPLLDHALRTAGSDQLLPGYYRGCLWAPQVILGSSPAFSTPDLEQLRPHAELVQTGYWFWEDPAWSTWQPSPQLQAICERRPLVLAFSSQPLENPGEILRKHVLAAAQLDMPMVVQRGWADFDERDLPPGSNRENVCFIDYAPHDWLFARAAASIQHGGIGSTARALRQFCPLVIEPFGNDQFYNAHRVVHLGAGVSLNPHEAAAEDISAAIEAVLSQRTRLHARLIGRQLLAEDGLSAAADRIEHLLDRQPADRGGSARQAAAGAAGELRGPDSSTQEIPRIIHHTWNDAEIPEQFHSWYKSWRTHHPAWEFRLWTHDECRALIAEHYPWFLSVYDGYDSTIKRVDAEIYFLLFHFGGVYVDLDCEALRPLDPLLKNRQLVIAPEPPGNLKDEAKAAGFKQVLSNAVAASVPGHPFWRHVIDLLLVWRDAAEPMDAAGPFLLTRAYESFDAQQTMTLEAYQRLLPISVDEAWEELPAGTKAMIRRDAYVIHHWYGSWLMEPLVSEKGVVVQVLQDGRPQAEPAETTREQLLRASAGAQALPFVSCLMVPRSGLLQAQLAVHCFQKQSYTPRELIIIGDGPDDGLAAWLSEIADPSIRYFRPPVEERPLAALYEMAQTKARGDSVARWPDDQLFAPLRLELQVAAMQRWGADGCLLMRALIWIPGGGVLLRSRVAPREETALLPAATKAGRVVLLDMPDLSLTLSSGGGVEARQWPQAADRYRGVRYTAALAELTDWFGLDMQRLGAHLGGRPFPASNG